MNKKTTQYIFFFFNLGTLNTLHSHITNLFSVANVFFDVGGRKTEHQSENPCKHGESMSTLALVLAISIERTCQHTERSFNPSVPTEELQKRSNTSQHHRQSCESQYWWFRPCNGGTCFEFKRCNSLR